MENNSRWQVEINPETDWNTLDKDTFRFYFDQAEKRLKSTLEVAEKATQRAYSLLIGLVPLMTVLVSTLSQYYFYTPTKTVSTTTKTITITTSVLTTSPILVIACWVALILSFSVLTIAFMVIFPRSAHQLGREPKALARPDYFENPEFKGIACYILNLVDELEDYQRRINFMEKQNEKRVWLTKCALLIIASGFFLYTLLLIISAV
jgi:hypothetical protein